MTELTCISDAFPPIENGGIAEYGKMENLRFATADFTQHYDADGKLVANLIIPKVISSLPFIPYAFGSDLIKNIMLCGECVNTTFLH